MTTNEIECRTCKGVGHSVETVRYSGSGVGNKARTRKSTCRYCKGTGRIVPVDLTTSVREALAANVDTSAGISDWMLDS